jgi:hypothetical protein
MIASRFAALLDNLAALYEAEMRCAEARPIYRRALDICVKAHNR